MQLRFTTRLSSEEYVSERGWEQATLDRCPEHPEGGCGFARHTPYERKTPPGTLVARWYCPAGHQTYSLLPDCLASRLPGSLAEVEGVVREVEAGGTFEAAAAKLRPDIELQGALRWLRRRVAQSSAAARAVIGLLPERLAGCAPTLTSIAAALDVPCALIALREIARAWLASLPPSLGFGPRPTPRWSRPTPIQQQTGPPPPPSPR